MLTDAQREFLQKPIVGRMSTIDKDGYPHSVPVWHVLDGDDLVVFGWVKTAKVGHIRANTKGNLSIGGDASGTEGYLIKGDWSLEPDNGWSRKITQHHVGVEHADETMKEWGDLE